MNLTKWRSKLRGPYEETVYTLLAIAIIYSFFLWTLLNSLLCIAFVAYWLFISEKHFDVNTRKTRMMLLFIFLYVVYLSGLLYTSNIKEGWADISHKVPILIFPLIFGTTEILSAERINRIIYHFAMAMAGIATIGIFYTLFNFWHSGYESSLTGEKIIFVDKFYPYVMGLCGILSIVVLANDRTSRNPGIKLGMGIAISIYILMLNTRLITLLLAIAIIYFAYTFIKYPPYRLLVICLFATSIVMSVVFVPEIAGRWKELVDFSKHNTIELDTDRSLSHGWGGKAVRVAIWKCGFTIIDRHPLAGVGTGDVQDSLQAAYEERQFYFASRFNQYNAHNQYIQNMIGNGVAGLIAILAVIFIPLFWPVQNNLRAIYVPFILLFAIISLSEVVLDINKGIIWYAFFNSLLALPANNST